MTPLYTPVANTGGYQPIGSDRYPITITWVSSDLKKIKFRRAKYERTDKNGFGGDQEYMFWDDTTAPEVEAKLCKNNHYYTKGGITSGQRIVPTGIYSAYQDPSF